MCIARCQWGLTVVPVFLAPLLSSEIQAPKIAQGLGRISTENPKAAAEEGGTQILSGRRHARIQEFLSIYQNGYNVGAIGLDLELHLGLHERRLHDDGVDLLL